MPILLKGALLLRYASIIEKEEECAAHVCNEEEALSCNHNITKVILNRL